MNLYHLLAFTGLLSFVNTLGVSDQSRTFLRRSPSPPRIFPYRQASIKKARNINLPILGSSTVSFQSSATLTAPAEPRPQSDSKQSSRSSSTLRKKIFAYFQECHGGVQIHVQRIKGICSGQITNETAKKISWDLLAELQAILALCLTCLRKLKSCGSAPIPSSIPGVPENPLSVHDLGQMVLQLLIQLKICFSEMNRVCSRYEIIRTTCSDCLVQISSTASSCLSVSGTHISGLITTVTSLFGGNPLSFFGLHQFGLDSIIRIFK